VAEETRLDVLRAERLAQKWIFAEIYLADREVVGGAPVTVKVVQLLGAEVFHGDPVAFPRFAGGSRKMRLPRRYRVRVRRASLHLHENARLAGQILRCAQDENRRSALALSSPIPSPDSLA
jgi:hypothetical protein